MKDPIKMRASQEVLERVFTRDHLGNRITIDWGTPDAEGFCNPVFTVNVDDNIATTLTQPLVERIAAIRLYVANNLDAWDPGITLAEAKTGAQQLEVAYADIYRKVLDVIDTGNPL